MGICQNSVIKMNTNKTNIVEILQFNTSFSSLLRKISHKLNDLQCIALSEQNIQDNKVRGNQIAIQCSKRLFSRNFLYPLQLLIKRMEKEFIWLSMKKKMSNVNRYEILRHIILSVYRTIYRTLKAYERCIHVGNLTPQLLKILHCIVYTFRISEVLIEHKDLHTYDLSSQCIMMLLKFYPKLSTVKEADAKCDHKINYFHTEKEIIREENNYCSCVHKNGNSGFKQSGQIPLDNLVRCTINMGSLHQDNQDLNALTETSIERRKWDATSLLRATESIITKLVVEIIADISKCMDFATDIVFESELKY